MVTEVGIDVGGTFTDLVTVEEQTGAVRVAKVPSTPRDPSAGLMHGLAALALRPSAIDLVIHGTTVATNAVLERKGARCGLIMTEGFRDVLELRRRDRPDTYGLKGRFAPLVPRERRVEVAERTDYQGRVRLAPDAAQVAAAARTLLDKGCEVVVVSFLNAYANPANEQAARRVLETVWPNEHIVIASEVLPEIREFERTSTAVLNGYVQPLLARYLATLMERLRGEGYARDVLLIQCNGGVASQQVARRMAVNTILSGPAAGVIAARHIGRSVGERNLITCDIGGTSLDIAVVEGDHPATTQEVSLDYGLPLRTTMLDIRTVGAGGGSIAWIDRAGILRTGPHSAGADPGPVCYGLGGEAPTVTDANLLLGRIGETHPIGREPGFRFDKRRAEAVIETAIARPLGLSVTEAAWAIVHVTNHRIAAAIRTLTVERGYDPRDFTLVAYGGAGPLHAGAIVRELEIARALVPPWPGITSALGCVTADVRHDFLQTLNQRLDALHPDDIAAVFERHVTRGRELIAREGIHVERIAVRYQADMAYDGQIHEVRATFPAARCSHEDIRRAFEAVYTTHYGATLGERPLRIRTLNTAVIGVRPRTELPRLDPAGATTLAAARNETRPVYTRAGLADTPVYERARLPDGAVLHGPAVVEQPDATTVIEPAMRAAVDTLGNLIIEEEG